MSAHKLAEQFIAFARTSDEANMQGRRDIDCKILVLELDTYNRTFYRGQDGLDAEEHDTGRGQTHSVSIQSPILREGLTLLFAHGPTQPIWLKEDQLLFRPSSFLSLFDLWDQMERMFRHIGVQGLAALQDEPRMQHFTALRRCLNWVFPSAVDQKIDMEERKVIDFNRLWMFMKPGAFIERRNSLPIDGVRRIKKAIYIRAPEERYLMVCVRTDWDGSRMVYHVENLSIPRFYGQVSMTEMRFQVVDDASLEYQKNVGRKFESLAGKNILKNVNGEALCAVDGEIHRFRVSGQVVIDAAAFRKHNTAVTFEDRPVKLSGGRLRDEDAMCCIQYVLGYSLQTRRWLEFHVKDISDVEYKDEGEELQKMRNMLPADQWANVWVRVSAQAVANITKDIINEHDRPKTRFIVLSGGVGTGKTHLAQLIATMLRVPLVSLFQSDFVRNNGKLDVTKFVNMMEQAREWGAVLLFQGWENQILPDSPGAPEFVQLLESLQGVVVCLETRIESEIHEAFDAGSCIHVKLQAMRFAARWAMWNELLIDLEDGPNMTAKEICEHLVELPLNGNEITSICRVARVFPASERAFGMRRLFPRHLVWSFINLSHWDERFLRATKIIWKDWTDLPLFFEAPSDDAESSDAGSSDDESSSDEASEYAASDAESSDS
ncbi:hypothetical protein ACHAQA_005102 [Verticillium albo-atrum]